MSSSDCHDEIERHSTREDRKTQETAKKHGEYIGIAESGERFELVFRWFLGNPLAAVYFFFLSCSSHYFRGREKGQGAHKETYSMQPQPSQKIEI
eukprot:scaffold2243_cov73-Cyclotella_meneghiniana.AAC.8